MITSHSDAPGSTILLVANRKYIHHLGKEDGNPGFSFLRKYYVIENLVIFSHKFNQISPIYT